MGKTEDDDNSQPRNDEEYENKHVHSVYDQIAPHFSATRYKPWPLISTFLSHLPPGSVGLDVGCGNGKYLGVNPGVFIVASDTSLPLLQIARQYSQTRTSDAARATNTTLPQLTSSHSDVCQASAIFLPHHSGQFDFAISIAVIHHLSTRDRRVEAVRSILDALRPWMTGTEAAITKIGMDEKAQPPEDDQASIVRLSGSELGGKCLIFVWALEQKGSRRGWDEGDEQDVMVPWVSKGGESSRGKGGMKKRRTMAETEGRGENGGNARSYESNGESNVSPKDRTIESDTKEEAQEKTYYRYYHLYKKDELEQDVEAAGGVVLAGGWERDNWWVVAAKET